MERQVFGKEIKRRRKEKKKFFSQYDLAVGICSLSPCFRLLNLVNMFQMPK